MDAFGRRTQSLDFAAHQIADHDGRCRLAQSGVAQRRQARGNGTAHERHAELDRGFRINILQPVHQPRTVAPRDRPGDDGHQRRVGLGDHDIARPHQFIEATSDRPVERDVVDRAADQRCAAECGRCDAVHVDAVDGFTLRQRCLGIVVDLPAGDEVDLASGAGEIEGEIGKDLACRRMVGCKKSIDEDQSAHRGPARQSILGLGALRFVDDQRPNGVVA